MRKLFDSAESVEFLRAELRRWEGTPYVDHVAICQGGGDCVRTADAILRACGWVADFAWPAYMTTGDDPLKLIDTLDGIPELERIEELEPGAVVAGVSRSKGNPHLAIAECPDFIWHMNSGHGRVGWCRRHRQVAHRAWGIVGIWRPLKNEINR